MSLSRLLGVVSVVALASLVAAAVAWPTPVYPAPLEDGEAIVDAHAAALEAAGSFTYRDTTRLSVNGTLTANRTTVALFDTDSGAALVDRWTTRAGRHTAAAPEVRESPRSTRLTAYRDGAGTSYERLAPDTGAVRYGQPLSTATLPSPYRRPGIAPLLAEIEYTYEGPTRLDGVRVHEYAATTPRQLAGAVGPDLTGPAVETRVDVRVFVSSDGIVRRMTVLVVQRDGTRSRTLDSTLAYTGIGETTVPEPAWLETARERAGPSR